MRKPSLPSLAAWTAAVVIAIALLEIVLRAFDPVGISYFWEVRRYQESLVRGVPYTYIHAPQARDRFQGFDVRMNSLGLRSPELGASGRRRLLILGDSVVFGWGVAQDQIVSAQAQRVLDERAPGSWEVVGAGVVSWNTRNEFEFLVEEGDRIGAAAIALIVTSNDVVPHDEGRTAVAIDSLRAEFAAAATRTPRAYRWLVAHSYAIATAHYLRRARAVASDRPEKFCDASPASSRDASLAMESMAAYCRERGIVLVPFLFLDPVSPCWELFEGVLARNGLEARALPVVLRDQGYRNSAVDPHPNAKGHRLMAEKIVEELSGETSLH